VMQHVYTPSRAAAGAAPLCHKCIGMSACLSFFKHH
jgi:hypothetical protein